LSGLLGCFLFLLSLWDLRPTHFAVGVAVFFMTVLSKVFFLPAIALDVKNLERLGEGFSLKVGSTFGVPDALALLIGAGFLKWLTEFYEEVYGRRNPSA